MANKKHNLLDEPLIGVVSDTGGRRQLSLPDVLAALADGEDIEFTALRRHQHHSWFAFLVQLAAICLHRREDEDLSIGAPAWRKTLLDLSGSDAGWCLVVDDLEQPAFMQPPVPESVLSALKNQITTPDGIDILMVTRNHDIKRTTMHRALPEHWLYALVCLQTMQGFLGLGNYGISRMNGGFSSRPGVGVASKDDWAARFKRDVGLYLSQRALLERDPWPFQKKDGLTLLWLAPWNGSDSLAMSNLDPLYIEVCRRVRLHGETAIAARIGSSKVARIASKDRNGDTGDIWTPVTRDSRKSLTVSADGFSYRSLQDFAFGADWLPAPAQQLASDPQAETILIARVLVRGQGETKGYHERLVPIPGQALGFFKSVSGRDLIGQRAKTMVDLAASAHNRVLKPALLNLLQGGPDDLNFKDKRTNSHLQEFERSVDDIFFLRLFGSLDDTIETAQAHWEAELWRLAREHFERASMRMPMPQARRYRARARAERALFGSARKNLPNAFAQEQEIQDHQQTTEELADDRSAV